MLRLHWMNWNAKYDDAESSTQSHEWLRDIPVQGRGRLMNWQAAETQKSRKNRRKEIFCYGKRESWSNATGFSNKPQEITCKLYFSVDALIELLRSSLTCQVCRLPSTCSVGFDFKSASHFTSSCFVWSFVPMHIERYWSSEMLAF